MVSSSLNKRRENKKILIILIGSVQEKHLSFVDYWEHHKNCLGQNMAFKLSFELVDVAKGNGDIIRRKEETRRMVEANLAFAHFR